MRKIQKPNPPTGLQRILWRLPISLFRAHLGFLVSKRIMLLTHIGRNSGQPRQAALEVVEHREDGSIIAASGFGAAADWYKNVRKTPEVTIQVGARTRQARAVALSTDEGGDLMAHYAMKRPRSAKQLSRLMGFEVDGSAADFREVGRAIPFVRFAPAD
ncbi:nitroreductase family deazaflavin-dependent oxidoreductase [Mycobacteroides immunogenum]|uniref:Nitroreductase n=1 Tax=Mycobacteroides immunogenum TaxID=83262 RepID=A0A7V8RW45_9MYCO|nr:nitroreductase family deazaflavin-dependent oxidoreductase [Mycobacteroides immunogenum]AMT71890.1 nitroreductase [Mycobacteroides immunogenum]ANO05019.1 nitroreductase [Mycobacteroides immunogenum]KIU39447.1 nitroreductase [Mycobacteroides immunogenum]KPG07097.1 nitroreductase [Mycobacteroides immunogenum]KPG07433.1 nitroreductase [Mycobacteroides immunogenum]